MSRPESAPATALEKQETIGEHALGSGVVSTPQITLTVRLSTSALDARRGVVRLHPEVLDALGLRQWDAVRLTGARSSAALAAAGQTAPGTALLDDLTLSNLGLTDGSEVVLAPVRVPAARSITVAGSALVSRAVSPETLRRALAGKVLTNWGCGLATPAGRGPWIGCHRSP